MGCRPERGKNHHHFRCHAVILQPTPSFAFAHHLLLMHLKKKPCCMTTGQDKPPLRSLTYVLLPRGGLSWETHLPSGPGTVCFSREPVNRPVRSPRLVPSVPDKVSIHLVILTLARIDPAPEASIYINSVPPSLLVSKPSRPLSASFIQTRKLCWRSDLGIWTGRPLAESLHLRSAYARGG